jgi:hypothetical protein
MSTRHLAAFLFLFLLTSTAFGQTFQWSPINTGTVAGGSNNTIPWWSLSSAYQQIHEGPTVGKLLITKGMGFRPAGNRTITGRTCELRLTLAQTSSTAAAPSLTFANNIGATNTKVVFGTATTFTKFTWSNFTTNGFQPAFVVPFNTTYVFAPNTKEPNLCWEWRHKNATTSASMAMDASSALATNNKGTTLPSTGTGCTATGKTSAARCTMTTVRPSTSSYQHHLEVDLVNGANTAPAYLAISLSNSTTSLGWCAPVINPALLLALTTTSSGSFKLTQSYVSISGTPSFSVYTQFAFADAGLPGGLGLTDVAGFKTPVVPGAHGICRLYAYGSSGAEAATSATGSTKGYGLSVAFQK